MKTTHWALGLLAATLSLGLFTGAHAQGSPYQQTTSTSLYPSVTTTTSTTTVGQTAPNLSGQVTSTDISTAMLGEIDEQKMLTLSPGRGVFSIDSLHFGDRLGLTLVNPTNVPLRFETVQRPGQEFSWLVPPNSQQTVSFVYTHPFSDEVKFIVYQDPVNAIAANNAISQQAMASSMQQVPMTSQTTQTTTTVVPQGPEAGVSQPPAGRSAVRGFW